VRYAYVKKHLIGKNIIEIGSTDNLIQTLVKNIDSTCADMNAREGIVQLGFGICNLAIQRKSLPAVYLLK
jgi:hypothetical protein